MNGKTGAPKATRKARGRGGGKSVLFGAAAGYPPRGASKWVPERTVKWAASYSAKH